MVVKLGLLCKSTVPTKIKLEVEVTSSLMVEEADEDIVKVVDEGNH